MLMIITGRLINCIDAVKHIIPTGGQPIFKNFFDNICIYYTYLYI